MNRPDTSDFLYKYFRKLTASFQSSLYKTAITCNVEDIHKARVDIKKLNTLFMLFDDIMPGFSKKTGARILFKDLFSKAGKIRELQLILLFFEMKNDPDPVFDEFQKWLMRRNNLLIRQYLKSVFNFDRNGLKDLTRSTKKLLRQFSSEALIRNSLDMIEKNSFRVRYLLTGWNDQAYIHKIRHSIKSMSAIANQVSSVAPSAGLNPLLSGLSKTEIAIGEWHDKVVIISEMEQFMKSVHYARAGSKEHFLLFRDRLKQENEEILENLKPRIVDLVTKARSISRGRNYLR